MTIQEIKNRTQETAPYFFISKTLKFFGQTMKSFKVYKQQDGKYLISAPMKDRNTGKTTGYTERLFNPETNILEHVVKD